jgi:hypothetical protein
VGGQGGESCLFCRLPLLLVEQALLGRLHLRFYLGARAKLRHRVECETPQSVASWRNDSPVARRAIKAPSGVKRLYLPAGGCSFGRLRSLLSARSTICGSIAS